MWGTVNLKKQVFCTEKEKDDVLCLSYVLGES